MFETRSECQLTEGKKHRRGAAASKWKGVKMMKPGKMMKPEEMTGLSKTSSYSM